MKLPDFLIFEPINTLKSRMGIPHDQYGSLGKRIIVDRLPESALDEELESSQGVEITLDELQVNDDWTLSYKGRRVLLYIRDVAVYGNRDADPRFHVSHCSMLREMRQKQRFGRYVISTRVDGNFTINLIGQSRSETRRLAICQFCLGQLRYDEFSMEMTRTVRRAAVARFNLQEFFGRYPISPHNHVPTYDSDNAPRNDYSDDFVEISRRVRQAVGYRCQNQKCGIDLSAAAHRRFLHVHHKNGMKNDNRLDNLVALCLGCHANEPNHAHMKRTAEYREFQRSLS